MALVLNEEQQILRDTARTFLQERAPVSHLRKLRDSDSGEGFSGELWAEMAAMGWSAILVPERYNGLNYGFAGMGILLEQSGRTLTSSPLLATALTGVAAITTYGSEAQQAAILPAVVKGEHLLALACDDTGQHDPYQVSTKASETDTGYRINGHKTAVLDGHTANTFIVSARTGSDISLFLIPADSHGISVEPYPVLDTHFACHVKLDQVEVDKSQLLGELNNGQAMLEVILDIARIGTSAEMLGIAQEAFERTIEYLKERKQFGVLIGSFQSLQHRAAHLFGEIEMCKSLVIKALHELDKATGNHAELASLTKARLCDTAHLATTEAIQMHGGIGMTDDFDIGFFLKRCQILESLYGDRYYHLDRFARQRGY